MWIGRTPAEAVQKFIDSLTNTLRRVTDAPLVVSGYYSRPTPHSATFKWGPAPLRGQVPLSLVVRHSYLVAEAVESRGQNWVSAAHDQGPHSDRSGRVRGGAATSN